MKSSFEEISDKEAQLILKIVASGDFHLNLRQNKSGKKYGQLYPVPVANNNYVNGDYADYIALHDMWNEQTK